MADLTITEHSFSNLNHVNGNFAECTTRRKEHLRKIIQRWTEYFEGLLITARDLIDSLPTKG